MLTIWQTGFDIALNCYRICSGFPTAEKFGLSSQIQRAAVSISSNIAEGSSRKSRIDFNRFILIAQGSVFETETQLLLALKLEMGDSALIKETLTLLDLEGKMLTAFSKRLLAK